MNNELYKDIEIRRLIVDDVSWKIAGISEDENARPFIDTRLGFDSDSPDIICSTSTFTFASDENIYFKCKVEILALVPETTFEDVFSDPLGRRYVANVCNEMAMGHIRNMLIYATSMAGLGTPILLSGIMPATLRPEAFPEILSGVTEKTSEE